jgi:hypothetical protein
MACDGIVFTKLPCGMWDVQVESLSKLYRAVRARIQQRCESFWMDLVQNLDKSRRFYVVNLWIRVGVGTCLSPGVPFVLKWSAGVFAISEDTLR